MLGKILLAFMLAQGAANAPNGAIRGQIIVPEAHASERLQVTLYKTDGPLVSRIFSDVLGNYEFHGLIPGAYVIEINVEGYEQVRTEVGVGSGSFGAQIVNVHLREKETIVRVGSNLEDSPVDVSELGRKYPRKAVQDYDRAIDELRKGNDVKALDLLAGVVKSAPDHYAAHNTLGTVYQRTQRFRDAEAEYTRARELNPHSADPLVNLGSLFIDEAAARSGEGSQVVGKILDDALDILEEALKMKRSAMGYYLLGTAYYKSMFYEEAEQNLNRAIEMDAHLGSGHLMLANLYMRQQKWQRALEQLDSYLIDNPKASDRDQIRQTRAKVAERVRE
jgi:Tfp pilus assembly protein PilF